MHTNANIDQLKDFVGRTVTLKGWVLKNTPKGKLIFLTRCDGTGFCRCVIEQDDATRPFFEEAKQLSQESAIEIVGEVRADQRSAGGHERIGRLSFGP